MSENETKYTGGHGHGSQVNLGALDEPAFHEGTETVEQEIQRKGLTAPRVSQAELDANIVDQELVTFVSRSGQVLRWQVLTTRNGFAVVGRPSCAVSLENDDPALGARIALENSKDELWPLMGYALRNELAKQDER